jgi:sulfatase modifying factor 1
VNHGAAVLGWLLLPLACTPAALPAADRAPLPPPGRAAPADSPAATAADAESPEEPPRSDAGAAPAQAELPEAEQTPSEPAALCPQEMALVHRVQGPYCIDRWEAAIVVVAADGSESPWPGNHTVHAIEGQMKAASVAGRKPQGYISGEQAAQACARAGKRLCEIDEWVRACRGPQMTLYPYGNQRRPKLCNDRFRKLDYHPVVRLFRQAAPPGTDPVQMWHPRWMNDPRLHEFDHTVAPTGAFEQCTNEYGVYDMVGNLHEWVADPEGTFFGGFFMDTFQNGEGCEYRTVAHPFDYHDYSTGFRCCADPAARP